MVALAAQLADATPEQCDRVALGDLTRAVSQVRSFCDAMDARIARRAGELAEVGESEPAEAVVANHGRRSSAERRTAVRRAEVCERHQGFGEALAEISGGRVEAGADPDTPGCSALKQVVLHPASRGGKAGAG